MITKGAVWTVGYQDSFTFMVDTSYPVAEDPLAMPFKELTVAITQKILDGATLRETWDAGIDKCNELITLLSDRPELDYAEVIQCLQHNRDCMIGLGDEEAYVLPPMKLAAVSPEAIFLVAAFLVLTGIL